MSLNDSLASALSMLNSYENLGRTVVVLKPSSKMLKKVLDIMNEKGYVGKYEEIVNLRGNELHLNLLGKLNKCGVIKPRFPCKVEDYEKFEKRFLLAKGFGMILVSTTQGIITHEEAKEKGIGGKLIAYCY